MLLLLKMLIKSIKVLNMIGKIDIGIWEKIDLFLIKNNRVILLKVLKLTFLIKILILNYLQIFLNFETKILKIKKNRKKKWKSSKLRDKGFLITMSKIRINIIDKIVRMNRFWNLNEF